MSLQTLLEDYTKARQKFVKEAQKEFKKEIKEFFKECPEIKVIKWLQFTPYFNDGEPCVFGVRGIAFSNANDPDNINVYGEYEGEEEGVWIAEGSYGIPEKMKHLKPKINELDTLLSSSAMEDVLLDLFGDHVVVTATEKNITVDSYEHE